MSLPSIPFQYLGVEPLTLKDFVVRTIQSIGTSPNHSTQMVYTSNNDANGLNLKTLDKAGLSCRILLF